MTSNQSDYLFESFFLIAMQNTLMIVYLVFEDYTALSYKNRYGVNMCILITTLILHFSCLGVMRNGIAMCKYVVFHSHEFDNPYWAFFLGFMMIEATFVCQVTNII